MKEEISYIIEEIGRVGVDISEIQAEQFYDYYELLVERNKVMNLTAITDFKEVVKKHFADSLTLLRIHNMDEVRNMIDVGTGAGFPGIPLKIVCPDVKLTLLDSLGKRVKFLEDVAEKLDLRGVECVHSRTEDLAGNSYYREQYDLVTARAVAAMNVLSEYCLPYVKIGGVFAAYKSGTIEEELAAAERAISVLGGKVRATEKFQLDDMGRSIVLIEKTRKTPKSYPRKAGTPSRSPIV
jgi:16S rRNA (guanine527-N7)-methyltransferase